MPSTECQLLLLQALGKLSKIGRARQRNLANSFTLLPLNSIWRNVFQLDHNRQRRPCAQNQGQQSSHGTRYDV